MGRQKTQIRSVPVTESASATAPLAIRLFGTFEMEQGGLSLPRTRTVKEKWLLALLVLRHRETMDRTLLAGILWPESSETQALGNLRRSLNNLRQSLGDHAYRLFAPTPRTLSFDLSGVHCDLTEFDHARTLHAPVAWEKAVSCYRGPFLLDCKEGWAEPERSHREQEYLRLLEQLAAHYTKSGDTGKAIPFLRLAVNADPFREATHQSLMNALADSGDITGAMLVYRQFRLRLHEELQTNPAPETTALYQRLRHSPPAAPPASPPPVPPGMPTAAPRRLPIPLASLIGRRQEIATLHSLLGASRLVTLTGTGGVGKTRLAIQAAEENASNFEDGLYFVPLATVSEGEQAARVTLTTLGLREDQDRPVVELLREFLRQRNVLLIFDNCEHLIEATALLADQLLSTCPSLRILATSREPLHLTGEWVFRVPSLETPGSDVFSGDKSQVNDLMDYSAIRLFVDRARAVSTAFRLTPQNAADVVAICTRLDGIPLAIELAATRISSLTASQIAARLEDRFTLLTGGSRAALPRHRTLRAALDWSYDLLSPAEKLLLQRLSVFTGDFSLEAARVVTAPLPDFLDLFTGLVEKSLAVNEEKEDQARYRLLETVREYAGARLLEKEKYERRHLVYYAWLGEKAMRDQFGPRMAEYLEMIEQEWPNIRTVLDRGRSNHRFSVRALRLAMALDLFWRVRGRIQVGVEYLSALLNVSPEVGGNRLRARAHSVLALIYSQQYRLSESRRHCLLALTLFRPLGDTAGMSDALTTLSIAEHSRGNNNTAHRHSLKALQMARKEGWRRQEARALHQLGNIAKDRSQFEEARECYQQAIDIRSEFQDQLNLALGYFCLGLIARRQRDFSVAEGWYVRSLEIYRTLRSPDREAYLLSYLADLFASQGDIQRALQSYQECFAKMVPTGNYSEPGRIYLEMCLLQLRANDGPAARHSLFAGLHLVRHSEDNRLLGHASVIAALVLAGEGAWHTAILLFGAGRELLGTTGNGYILENPEYDQWQSEAKAIQGEETFTRLLRAGGDLSLTDVWSLLDTCRNQFEEIRNPCCGT